MSATATTLLSTTAFDILRHWFVDGYRLSLSPTHEAALRAMLDGFAKLITGQEKGRIAWPLPPGAGKSQSIAATITALHVLGLDHAVTVAASRVESLCELIRDLRNMGKVPEEKIGLLHSKLYRPRWTPQNRP